MTDHPSNPPSQTKGQEIAALFLGTGSGSMGHLAALIDSALAAQEARHKAAMEKTLAWADAEVLATRASEAKMLRAQEGTKSRGCTLCDRLRKGDRTVKPSRNKAVHWTLAGDRNEWRQVPCLKEPR